MILSCLARERSGSHSPKDMGVYGLSPSLRILPASSLLEYFLPQSTEQPARQRPPRVPTLPEAQRHPWGTFPLWLLLAGDCLMPSAHSAVSSFRKDLGVSRDLGFLQENKGTDLAGL